jgi:septum site-determining protein MinC
MSANAFDYEQAGELKIGQVGIANLRVRTLDVPRLVDEMRSRVQRAPKLFQRAAVVLDFGGLAQVPNASTVQALIDGLREAGVLPVAIAYGTSETERLAEALGLPLLAKFRAQYERGDEPAPVPAQAPTPVRREPEPEAAPAKAAAAPHAGQPGMMHAAPVRSGQQVYADNRDLTVLSSVGAGAEVIADGSVHIYGPLRGRALAGAQGNEKARIFCREFHAELVAVAGHYKVLDDIPKDLYGKAVQVWLEDGQLKLAALD